MEILIFWLALAFIAGLIASGKGRSFVGFFLLSIILSPLIGIIGALIAKGDTVKMKKKNKHPHWSQNSHGGVVLNSDF